MIDKSFSKLSDFIYIKHGELSKDFCNNCIEKFKSDDRKHDGMTADGVDHDVKISTDLNIAFCDDWKNEQVVFFESLLRTLDDYQNIYGDLFNSLLLPMKNSGYQIQETKPGGFYDWHDDFSVQDDYFRVLTYIWYLNDINDGGYTEFIDGTKIKPEAGKLVLFPSTWTYLHRGVSPLSETKYISTGWVFLKKFD
jgi:hypothetical protein